MISLLVQWHRRWRDDSMGRPKLGMAAAVTGFLAISLLASTLTRTRDGAPPEPDAVLLIRSLQVSLLDAVA